MQGQHVFPYNKKYVSTQTSRHKRACEGIHPYTFKNYGISACQTACWLYTSRAPPIHRMSLFLSPLIQKALTARNSGLYRITELLSRIKHANRGTFYCMTSSVVKTIFPKNKTKTSHVFEAKVVLRVGAGSGFGLKG